MTGPVTVDASFDAGRGVAGLGIVGPGGFLLTEAALATSSQEAEAWAILRGLLAMSNSGFPSGSVLLTDALDVHSRLIEGGTVSSVSLALMDQIREVVEEFGYHVDWRRRSYLGTAHTAAYSALRLWRAGAAEAPSWWRPAA